MFYFKRFHAVQSEKDPSKRNGEHLGYPSADIITTMAERRRQWTETPDNARVLTTIADPSRASLAAVTAPTRLLFDVCVKSALCGVNVTFARFLAVCVRWRGWIDLERLDGVGCLEFDEEKAMIEDSMLREQIERYNMRLREFEEKQRQYRGQQERGPDPDLEMRRGMVRAGWVGLRDAGSCDECRGRAGLEEG
ncbi:hypothetical protein J6590_098498 [Homalodisca vitripennis]|nr:hypothetical protein J6590_013790 [Homalodisca vitripennis]KAG8308905.1 hypothetical protein J6590_098498 [Homalodisca vitripennis]